MRLPFRLSFFLKRIFEWFRSKEKTYTLVAILRDLELDRKLEVDTYASHLKFAYKVLTPLQFIPGISKRVRILRQSIKAQLKYFELLQRYQLNSVHAFELARYLTRLQENPIYDFEVQKDFNAFLIKVYIKRQLDIQPVQVVITDKKVLRRTFNMLFKLTLDKPLSHRQFRSLEG